MGLSDEQKKELNRKKRDENAAHAYEQILGELGFANVGASVSRKEREETHLCLTHMFADLKATGIVGRRCIFEERGAL